MGAQWAGEVGPDAEVDSGALDLGWALWAPTTQGAPCDASPGLRSWPRWATPASRLKGCGLGHWQSCEVGPEWWAKDKDRALVPVTLRDAKTPPPSHQRETHMAPALQAECRVPGGGHRDTDRIQASLCPCVCLSVPLSLDLHLNLSISVSLYLLVSLCLFVPLYLSLFLSLSLSFCVSLCLGLCLPVSLCPCPCRSVSLSLSLSLSPCLSSSSCTHTLRHTDIRTRISTE